MRPYERWNTLWHFFMVLDEEWSDDHATEEEAMTDATRQWPPEGLQSGLAEWHDAFDGADDEQVEQIVADFNPSYDPAEKFGGYRQWAEWVREHLERELASRQEG